MIRKDKSPSAFSQQLNGNFVGMLQWTQLDDLWHRVKANPLGWYASQSGEAVPESPLDEHDLTQFIDEVDALLRCEHKYDYCGIVYADKREQPGFIKIYDPHNMGSFCSCTSSPVQPRWVLSRLKPERLEDDAPLAGTRQHWWHRFFGIRESC